MTDLESVGKDDVWVHGGDVEMVDERAFKSIRIIPQSNQLLFDLRQVSCGRI